MLHYLDIHSADSESYAPCKKGPLLLPHDGDKASLLCRRNVKAYRVAVAADAGFVERTARRKGELGLRRLAAVHRATNLHRIVHPGERLELQLHPPPRTGLDELRHHRVAKIRELDAHGVTPVVGCLVRLERTASRALHHLTVCLKLRAVRRAAEPNPLLERVHRNPLVCALGRYGIKLVTRHARHHDLAARGWDARNVQTHRAIRIIKLRKVVKSHPEHRRFPGLHPRHKPPSGPHSASASAHRGENHSPQGAAPIHLPLHHHHHT